MAALEAADDEVVDAVAVQNAEAVDKGGVRQGADLPAALCLGGGDDDLGLLGVVGGIELVGGQESAVSAGNRGHGHDAARLLPDRLQLGAGRLRKLSR